MNIKRLYFPVYVEKNGFITIEGDCLVMEIEEKMARTRL